MARRTIMDSCKDLPVLWNLTPERGPNRNKGLIEVRKVAFHPTSHGKPKSVRQGHSYWLREVPDGLSCGRRGNLGCAMSVPTSKSRPTSKQLPRRQG